MSNYNISTSSTLGSAGGWRRVINSQGLLLGYGIFGTLSLTNRFVIPQSWTLFNETGRGFVQSLNNDLSPVIVDGNEHWVANFPNRTLTDFTNWATTHFPSSGIVSPILNHEFGDVINFSLISTTENKITGVEMPSVASSLQQNDLLGDVPFEYNIQYSFNQWRITGTKTTRNIQATWDIQEIGDGSISETSAGHATFNTGLYATFGLTGVITRIEIYVNHTTQEISDVVYIRTNELKAYSATFAKDTSSYVV